MNSPPAQYKKCSRFCSFFRQKLPELLIVTVSTYVLCTLSQCIYANMLSGCQCSRSPRHFFSTQRCSTCRSSSVRIRAASLDKTILLSSSSNYLDIELLANSLIITFRNAQYVPSYQTKISLRLSFACTVFEYLLYCCNCEFHPSKLQRCRLSIEHHL